MRDGSPALSNPLALGLLLLLSFWVLFEVSKKQDYDILWHTPEFSTKVGVFERIEFRSRRSEESQVFIVSGDDRVYWTDSLLRISEREQMRGRRFALAIPQRDGSPYQVSGMTRAVVLVVDGDQYDTVNAHLLRWRKSNLLGFLLQAGSVCAAVFCAQRLFRLRSIADA